MKKIIWTSLLSLATAVGVLASGHGNIGTFSITGYDPVAKEWGVAVQSRFLAVGAVVPYAKAGVGAVASQAWGNTQYGPRGLELLEQGLPADSVLKTLLSADSNAQNRQVGVIDAAGRAATFTGKLCQSWAGGLKADYVCVQGNILAGPQVADSMLSAYQNTAGPLAQRLMAALIAGQAAGGDSRGMQSAALLVVTEGGGYSGYNDRMIDLRVDDHPRPIEELDRLYQLHRKTFGVSACLRIAIESEKQGDTARSRQGLERASEIASQSPEDAQLLNEMAWEMAVSNYRLERALELALKAMALAPGDANIIDTAAEVYARLGNYKKAVELEKTAAKLSPNPEFKSKLKSWQKKQ